MAKKLYLHVGHGKTGSSYIQSILSTHRQSILDNLCINYPSFDKDLSAEGKISSGNGAIFLNDPTNIENVDQGSRGSSVLYSSEFLFLRQRAWLNSKVIKELLSFYENIEILVFIRDPHEMLSSAYQQAVKRGGYTKSVDDFIMGFDFF